MYIQRLASSNILSRIQPPARVGYNIQCAITKDVRHFVDKCSEINKNLYKMSVPFLSYGILLWYCK